MATPSVDISHGLKPRASVHHAQAAEEPNTGREVLHTPIHASKIQELATADHPAVKAALESALREVDGAKLHGSRDAKPEARLREKVEGERQPPRTIPDYSGFRVAVESPESHQGAVKAIREHLTVVREKDEFEHGAPDTKFHAHMLQVRRAGAAVSHEVQVLPREQAEAAEANHALYDKARDGDQDAAATLKEKNEEAMQAFNERNGIAERKYEFGNTQANIPPESEAFAAIKHAQDAIPKDHLAGDGKDIDDPHVTVRYGIQGDNLDGIREFIKKQAPFTARLGKTTSFPPSKHSDGASPIIATVEAPELHRLNAEIQKHGDFAPSSFPDYKPHATVAYVKPEHAAKHTGNNSTEGKSFRVTHISISDRDGNKEHVPLSGNTQQAGAKTKDSRPKPEVKGDRGQSPEPAKADTSHFSTSDDVAKAEVPALPKIAKGSSVALPDGSAGIVQWTMGGKIRIKTSEGGRRDAALKDAVAIPPIEKTEGRWTGVDLDGTLAHYTTFKGGGDVGDPIVSMVDRVKEWLAAGQDVRVFTARVADDPKAIARRAIEAWLVKHVGRALPITNIKNHKMVTLYDDRAVQVSRNKGDLLGDPHAAAEAEAVASKPSFHAGLRPKEIHQHATA